jgi:NAD-dependent dihydropyrimidine dehydrogenase PreA subunit
LVRVTLRFSEEIVDEPITSQVILEENLPLNILSAHIDQQGGEILVEVPSTQVEKLVKAFQERGVEVEVRELIEKDGEKCIDCGACISLCPMDALGFGEDFSVELDQEKCIGITCGLCVDTCPVYAIKLLG